MRILLITIFEISLYMRIIVPHHKFRNIFLCEDYCVCSHHDIQIFLWPRKNHNIFGNTILCLVYNMLCGSLVVPMLDLETSYNFNNWFYSNPLSKPLTFISLCSFRICQFQDIFGNFVSKQACLNMSNLYQCLIIRITL